LIGNWGKTEIRFPEFKSSFQYLSFNVVGGTEWGRCWGEKIMKES